MEGGPFPPFLIFFFGVRASFLGFWLWTKWVWPHGSFFGGRFGIIITALTCHLATLPACHLAGPLLWPWPRARKKGRLTKNYVYPFSNRKCVCAQDGHGMGSRFRFKPANYYFYFLRGRQLVRFWFCFCLGFPVTLWPKSHCGLVHECGNIQPPPPQQKGGNCAALRRIQSDNEINK